MIPAIVKLSPGPGRPKDLEKRAAILEAAKKLFPINGFDGVSMDAIAAEAGVSKLTVYNHFTDKETLFVEAVREKCLQMLPDEMFLPEAGGPIEAALRKIGRSFFALVSSDVAMGLHRMILADTRNGAKLGQMFWQAGPARITESFRRFLDAAVATCQLDIADTETAAGQFLCLLKGAVNQRMICCGCGGLPDPEADARHIEACVTLFLRAYLPR
jgi:TetR/AcrR family transcriptional regulator, mexJK operon transcriptional repressor